MASNLAGDIRSGDFPPDRSALGTFSSGVAVVALGWFRQCNARCDPAEAYSYGQGVGQGVGSDAT